MTAKTGFSIPNASHVDPGVIRGFKEAEPDLQDWLALGNNRYGVVAGCTATISSGNIVLTESQNIVLVDGNVRYLPATASLSLLSPASQDRYDVFVWDDSTNSLRLIEGTPATDPITPEIDTNQVLLYMIWVPAGVTSLDNTYLVDKRILLPKGVVATLADEAVLLANTRSSSDTPFIVQGNGRSTWRDVSLYRHGSRELGVSDHLRVGNRLTVGQQLTSLGPVRAEGILSAVNFERGSGPPGGAQGGTADVYIQTDAGGAIWFKTDSGWAKLLGDVNVGDDPVSGIPPGTLIQSFLPPGHRFLRGFLPLDGSTYSSGSVQRLWDLVQEGLQPFLGWANIGNGTITFPNGNGLVLMQRADGSVGTVLGSNSKTIGTANLPAHRHFGGSSQTAIGGSHTHTISIVGGAHVHAIGNSGVHTHNINDPSHTHDGTNWFGQDFVGVVWGGQNRLDGPFNDSSHTYAVEPAASTISAATGITISVDGSAHSHPVSQDNHTHTAVIGTDGGHIHTMPTESEVGQGVPLDVTPASVGVKYYVKV